MVRICALVVMLLFSCSGLSLAETYKWVDDGGTVNFADDMSQVPKKYRKKVRVLGDIGPSESEDSGAAEEAKPVKEGEAPAGTGEGAEAAGKKKETLYGGKSGEAWKKEFAVLNADIRATDNQIAELDGRLSNTGGMSRTEYLGIQNSIKNLRYHRDGAVKKLDALNESASRAGVPGEYR